MAEGKRRTWHWADFAGWQIFDARDRLLGRVRLRSNKEGHFYTASVYPSRDEAEVDIPEPFTELADAKMAVEAKVAHR